jgi:hypothetical protein
MYATKAIFSEHEHLAKKHDMENLENTLGNGHHCRVSNSNPRQSQGSRTKPTVKTTFGTSHQIFVVCHILTLGKDVLPHVFPINLGRYAFPSALH